MWIIFHSLKSPLFANAQCMQSFTVSAVRFEFLIQIKSICMWAIEKDPCIDHSHLSQEYSNIIQRTEFQVFQMKNKTTTRYRRNLNFGLSNRLHWERSRCVWDEDTQTFGNELRIKLCGYNKCSVWLWLSIDEKHVLLNEMVVFKTLELSCFG